MFIRVELLGGADFSTYERLHAFMARYNWSRVALANTNPGPGSVVVKLPSATYTAIAEGKALDLATAFATSIKSEIWARASVLVMNTGESWAMPATTFPDPVLL